MLLLLLHSLAHCHSSRFELLCAVDRRNTQVAAIVKFTLIKSIAASGIEQKYVQSIENTMTVTVMRSTPHQHGILNYGSVP